MEKTDNPYTILGLSTDADESAMKKAYFQLAKKWHPDKQKTYAERQVATQAFAKIADAYDMLQDPVRRYDWKQANESSSRSSPPSPSSGRTRPMTSLSPKRNNSNSTTTSSAPKRTNHQSLNTAPKSNKASLQPNSVRVSPVHGRPLVRPSGWVTGARPSVVVPGRTPVRSPVRNSGGRSTVRTSGGRSPIHNSGNSQVRNSGRSPARNSGGRSPARNSGGRSPARVITASVSGASAVRRPHPANDRGRAPLVTSGVTLPLNRLSAGRRQVRPSSVGRKPKKNGLDSHSKHGPRTKPANERRRRLKRTSSLILPQQ